MSQVFVSWGSPDQSIVKSLCSRLRDTGVSMYEYSESMDVGDVIKSRVEDAIREAKVAIVCLSDKTAAREWILTEVALLHEARERGTLKAILPVKVGPLDDASVPKLLQGLDIYSYTPGDLSKSSEAVDRLLRSVYKFLGSQVPVALPAALFAMDSNQFEPVASKLAERYWTLCRLLAPALFFKLELEPPSTFEGTLKARYGKTSGEFCPFIVGESLVDTVHAAVRQLNTRRVREGQPPIFVRWVTEDLFGSDQSRRRNARDLWRSSNSLAIIDSLSTEHPDIQSCLKDLPDTDPDSVAIIWVPPYTQWTSQLETGTDEATKILERLNDFFRDWKNRGARWRAFDIGTTASLWQWVYRMYDELAEEKPLSSRVEAIKNAYGAPSFRPQDAIR